MKRLLGAGLLALIIHCLIFYLDWPGTGSTTAPTRRTMTIDLLSSTQTVVDRSGLPGKLEPWPQQGPAEPADLPAEEPAMTNVPPDIPVPETPPPEPVSVRKKPEATDPGGSPVTESGSTSRQKATPPSPRPNPTDHSKDPTRQEEPWLPEESRPKTMDIQKTQADPRLPEPAQPHPPSSKIQPATPHKVQADKPRSVPRPIPSPRKTAIRSARKPEPRKPARPSAAAPAASTKTNNPALPTRRSRQTGSPAGRAGRPDRDRPTVPAKPMYSHNPPPRYPLLARKRGHQGTVLLSVLVSASGNVQDIGITSSSGHASLDKAAVSAVGKWRFIPGKRDGIPVAMRVGVPIRFELQ